MTVTNEEHAAYMRAWRKANPEHSKASDKRNYDKNKKGKKRTEAQKKLNNAVTKAYQERHPDRVRNSDYKKNYGITLDQYNAMSKKQNHKCAICKKPETQIRRGKLLRLSVDHNHTTGKVRGLLCTKCNLILGYIENHMSDVTKISKYLEKHK